MYACFACRCPKNPEEASAPLELELHTEVESPRRCWEVIAGLLDGYPEVFYAEPSLQPDFGNVNPKITKSSTSMRLCTSI